MGSQLSDGFQCFLGTNPRDPSDTGCVDSAWLLMSYIIINFIYNIMMLAITKKGSAVLLVTSQALSLPITNIAFSLKSFMGENAEPLTITDLAGLVLVCIGFVAYSGLGFAKNFMVAQGPPGQMAYAHFEDHNEIVVTTRVAVEPEKLADFVVGGIIREHLLYQEHQEQQLLALMDSENDATGETSSLMDNKKELKRRRVEPISPLDACTTALSVLKKTTSLVETHERLLRSGTRTRTYLTSPAILNRLDNLSKRKGSTTDPLSVSSKQYGTRDLTSC